MIVLDCDGTLLNSSKKISDVTKNAIAKAKNNGIKVMLASARPFYRLKPILATLGTNVADQFTIAFNGGLIVNNTESEIVLAQCFTAEQMKRILEVGDQVGTMMFLYTRNAILSNLDDPKYRNKNPDVDFRVQDLHTVDYTQTEIFKVAYVNKPEVTVQLKATLPQDMYEDFEISSSVPQFVEFTRKGVTKAYALDLICKKIGIGPTDVVAFGDEDNDLPMLSFAGLGVAMGNASQLVKNAADYVTATNDEDGVAAALSYLGVI
jgi:Cof subfamily protein (haloacid dehalogenase superfamily)